MSRTAHHVPHHQTPYGKRRRAERDSPLWREQLRGRPWRRVDFFGLRYSHAEKARAAEEGRRPRPRRIRRAFEVHAYCCAWRSASLKEAANRRERVARMRLRVQARRALWDPETVIEPYRTRHQEHWHSW
ncbi:hypothetical protein [Streptomyces sp. NPDC058157]|uniref:hypothetical protein n=1 Tax=Streptomyces sp. NPDC058157 TaxID=3346360 RepID=UPI0036F14FEA